MTSECLIQNDYYFSQCKSVFDELEGAEMRKARTHSNPFELIKGVFFQNRAAMKMANMDAIFDFMFTSPKDRNGASMIKVITLGIWFLACSCCRYTQSFYDIALNSDSRLRLRITLKVTPV